jgi:hypothetical protein
MPITDKASIAVLSKLGSAWECLKEEISATEEGWDVMNAVFIKDYGATVKTSHQVAAEWTIGLRVFEDQDFWVVGVHPSCLGGNIWQVEITAHGMMTGRPFKIRIHSSAESQSFTDVSVGPPFWPHAVFVNKGTVLEAQPTIHASYVLIGQEPPTDRLGRAGAEYQVPPLDLPVRPSVWTSIVNPTFHFPHGWVFADLDVDRLSGTDTPVSLVTEIWNYRYLATP